jgi:Ni/Co efflux regulator RcnB
MKNLSLIVAAVTVFAVAAPMAASAETVVIKHRDGFRDARADYHRDHGWHNGWHHHDKKVVIIKKGYHHY